MDITVIITSLLQLAFAIFMVVGTFVVKKYLPHWLEANFSNSELVAIQNFIAYMIKQKMQKCNFILTKSCIKDIF